MKKALVPVDGSDRTARAISYLIEQAARGPRPEVVVVNVQPKPKLWQTRGIATKAILERLRMLGEVATSYSLERLAAAGISHKCRLELADSEIEAISRCAREEGCDHIVIAAKDMNSLAERLRRLAIWPFRSLAARVVDRVNVPVIVVRDCDAESIGQLAVQKAPEESSSPTPELLGGFGPQYRAMRQ